MNYQPFIESFAVFTKLATHIGFRFDHKSSVNSNITVNKSNFIEKPLIQINKILIY